MGFRLMRYNRTGHKEKFRFSLGLSPDVWSFSELPVMSNRSGVSSDYNREMRALDFVATENLT